MLQIRRLTSGDESTLREIRLRALLDSPIAYGSTYEREFDLVDVDWHNRITRNDAATFVCDQDERVAIGLVTGAIDEDISVIAGLLSMWVDPDFRGKGVVEILIMEVVAWSKLQNCTTIRLNVTEGNERAERAYEKHGFRRTGVTEIRERDQVVEFEMELNLD